MKRGKDDEKITGPMFPRLHVNDTEKGGPRAPPRNKMALYEQLSIPRFNSNSSNLVFPASSSQGSGVERNVLFPRYLPASTPHMAETFHTRHSDGVNLSNPLAQLEKRKKAGDEDDFMVPVFVQSGIGQCHSKPQNRNDNENFTSFSPSDASLSMKFQDAGDKDPKRTSFQGINLRQEARIQDNKNTKEHSSSGDHSAKSAANLSTKENINEPLKEANASANQGYCDHPVVNPRRLHDSDPCLQQEYKPRPLSEDTVSGGSFGEQMRDIEGGNVVRPRSNSPSGEVHSCPNEPDNDTGYTGDKTRESVRTCNMDKNDDASETSMVDSILAFDISPDDVVGIIGPKHFWKARRAIVNQQRVFAVQVFELHRLIKVQRLIAGSPHLLLEDGAYLEPSLKDSPAKKRPAEYVVKPPADIVKWKDESEKANHKMECSAENAFGKTFPYSVKNGSQPSNYEPYIRNPPPAPAATDTRMGPWCYQSPGHQWLLPVMSPSEGLVYKPYPGPGFTGTVCGGSGPFGPTPLAGNFMNPAYGIPPHHHQGIGVLPDAPQVGHSYFPPYAMLINPAISGSSVEQTNQFAGTASRDQTVQVSGGGSNFNIQRQNSCDTSTQKGEAVPRDVKFPASKDSELQGSTASSPSDRGLGVRVGHTGEGRDALPLFPVAPVIPEAPAQLHENDQPRRVIKVVPHNPRSASESAARIFQSIQKERKQYE